jgi:RNA polymerase sigma factor (sigma-70 family)
MTAMLHHHQDYLAAAATERRARTLERRLPDGGGELEAMLRGAARGNAANWNALVARFTARVRKVARLHRLAPHDVDDVVQTTWLRLLEHIDSVRDPEVLGCWLETTARRECLRVIHKAGRERPAGDEIACDAATEPVAERELAAGVKRLVPAQQQLIGMLLAHPAMTYTEIAHALGTPIGSIGPTRARSLARLRRDPQLLRAIGQTP